MKKLMIALLFVVSGNLWGVDEYTIITSDGVEFKIPKTDKHFAEIDDYFTFYVPDQTNTTLSTVDSKQFTDALESSDLKKLKRLFLFTIKTSDGAKFEVSRELFKDTDLPEDFDNYAQGGVYEASVVDSRSFLKFQSFLKAENKQDFLSRLSVDGLLNLADSGIQLSMSSEMRMGDEPLLELLERYLAIPEGEAIMPLVNKIREDPFMVERMLELSQEQTSEELKKMKKIAGSEFETVD